MLCFVELQENSDSFDFVFSDFDSFFSSGNLELVALDHHFTWLIVIFGFLLK